MATPARSAEDKGEVRPLRRERMRRGLSGTTSRGHSPRWSWTPRDLTVGPSSSKAVTMSAIGFLFCLFLTLRVFKKW